MVLLLCPRFPGDKDGEGYPSLAQSPSPRSSVDPASEEHRMLEAIFNPPENQVTTHPAETEQSSPSSVPHPLLSRSKSGRAKFELLSSKLRRRFSREARSARLLAKPSDNVCDDVNDTENGGLFQCAVTSADVLGITTANECAGYDSDAHKLLTPQITARLKGSPSNVRSPHILKESLPKTSGLYYHGYDGTPGEIENHTMGQGGHDGSNRPIHDLKDQSKAGEIYHAVENPFSGRLSRSIRSSRSTSETLHRSFSASTSSKKAAERRVRNCFSYSSLSQPNISIQSDQNASLRALETLDFSFLGYASSDPNFQIIQQPLTSQVHKPRTSGPEPEILVNAVQEELENHRPTNGHEMTVEVSNTFEPQETAHDKDVTLNNRQRPNSPVQVAAVPVRSRFTENLDDVFSPRVRGQYPEPMEHKQGMSKNRSSSDGWLSGGKRMGYGYNFILETDIKGPSTPSAPSEAPTIQPGTFDYDPESPTCLTLKSRKLRGLDQESQVGRAISYQPETTPIQANDPQYATVLTARSPNSRQDLRYQRSSSFPPWVRSAEQSTVHDFDSSMTVSTQNNAANVNTPSYVSVDNRIVPSTNGSSGNTFLKYLSRLSRVNSLNLNRKSARLDPQKLNPLERVDGKSTSMGPNENHQAEISDGIQAYQDSGAEANVSSSVVQSSCEGSDSRLSRPAPPPTSGIYDRSLDDTEDSQESLTEGCSAEAWSRLYDDCVQFPSYYDRSASACSGPFTTARERTMDTENCIASTTSTRRDGCEPATERTDLRFLTRVDSKENVPQFVGNSWGNSVLQASGALHI